VGAAVWWRFCVPGKKCFSLIRILTFSNDISTQKLPFRLSEFSRLIIATMLGASGIVEIVYECQN
jgi:hypothetical protein